MNEDDRFEREVARLYARSRHQVRVPDVLARRTRNAARRALAGDRRRSSWPAAAALVLGAVLGAWWAGSRHDPGPPPPGGQTAAAGAASAAGDPAVPELHMAGPVEVPTVPPEPVTLAGRRPHPAPPAEDSAPPAAAPEAPAPPPHREPSRERVADAAPAPSPVLPPELDFLAEAAPGQWTQSTAARGTLSPEPSPEAWLARIDSLLRGGRLEEARRQWRLFRLRHPDHPAPEDLRRRLAVR